MRGHGEKLTEKYMKLRYELLNVGDSKLPTDEEYFPDSGRWAIMELFHDLSTQVSEDDAPIRRLITSPWIKASERMPTKEDADEHGRICIINPCGGVGVLHWEQLMSLDLWIPCPKPEKPKTDFQRDYVEKLKGAALELWEMLSVSDRGGVRSVWEARNL